MYRSKEGISGFGRTDGRTDGQPENIMPPGPKGGGITSIESSWWKGWHVVAAASPMPAVVVTISSSECYVPNFDIYITNFEQFGATSTCRRTDSEQFWAYCSWGPVNHSEKFLCKVYFGTHLRQQTLICWTTRQIWGIWKLRPAYSPEMPNLGQNRWCFVPCDLAILRMTLKNNRAPLLFYFKLCASFRNHWCIETWVTVRKRPIWVKFDDF